VDKIGRFNFTLQSLIETIRTSPHVYDSAIHQSLLCLTGNLFMASDFYPTGSDKEKSIDDSNPFRCCNVEVITINYVNKLMTEISHIRILAGC